MGEIEFWVENGKLLAVGKAKPGAGPAMWTAFSKILKAVASSETGKKFLTQASEDRLREMIFISMFAGVGGTSDTVAAAMEVLKDSTKVPLFWKDPSSFIKEVARVYPAVAGIAFRQHKEQTVTLGNGRSRTIKKGELVYNWNAGANVDPTVFGGPEQSSEYAHTFDPTRENLDRMITLNAEWGEILKCS